MFATRPYRKFTDDHRAFDDVLRRLMKGADATKSATRSYTSPWDMTVMAWLKKWEPSKDPMVFVKKSPILLDFAPKLMFFVQAFTY